VLTAAAKSSPAARSGLSHTWIVSRGEPATSPVDRVWLVNGTALPGSVVSGGFGYARAGRSACDRRATTVAVAPGAAMKILSLDDMVASQISSAEPCDHAMFAARGRASATVDSRGRWLIAS
jgi:hypothetical protein